jgi:hypothetical protein
MKAYYINTWKNSSFCGAQVKMGTHDPAVCALEARPLPSFSNAVITNKPQEALSCTDLKFDQGR